MKMIVVLKSLCGSNIISIITFIISTKKYEQFGWLERSTSFPNFLKEKVKNRNSNSV